MDRQPFLEGQRLLLRPLIPDDFIDLGLLAERGVRLDPLEQRRLLHSITAWMLSQFLHGEQRRVRRFRAASSRPQRPGA